MGEGKPFQSRGCTTCKKRRIKCDQQEPDCARCVKRGLECPGYGSRVIFVNLASGKRLSTFESTKGTGSQIQRSQPPPLTLPGHVSRGPLLRVQLFSTFLNEYFPVKVNDAWHAVVTGWSTIPARTELFQHSLTSWACVSLGKTKNDKGLLEYGIEIYNQSIRIMLSMIRRKTFHGDIAFALLIWTELESHYLHDSLNAWMAHWTAFKAFIKKYQVHRPCSFDSVLGYQWNRFQKIITIFAIMTDGISNEQSSEIMAFRRDDTPLDQLLRLTTTSSVLSNVANTIDSSDNHACQCFLEDCLAQRDRILAWYSRWENDIGGSPALLEGHGFPFSNLSPTDDLFGSAYFFSSCDNARLLLIFFNAMRLVHPLIYQAKALVSPYAHNKLFDDEDYLLEGYYADQIARSIPYCLRDEHQSCFAHLSVILVTQLSKTYIDLRSPGRFMWCQEGFEVIASIGFICASHLKAIMLERWIRAGLPGPISISAADSGAKGERLEIPSLPSFMSFPTAAIGLTSQGANSKP